MRCFTLIAVTAIFVSALSGCGRERAPAPRYAVPREITELLDNSTQFVLLSVDPLPVDFPHSWLEPPKDVFHGHAVLGRTEIRDKAQRAFLLRALYKGIGESDGTTGHTCFSPRHAIHAVHGNNTLDLLICFECLWIRTYTHDGEGLMTTSDSPQKSFDDVLKAAHIPLAPPKGPNQAMQPTAHRRTASVYMTKTPSFQATLAVVSGG